jgi:thioesterase domain-containing protein
MGHGNPKAWLEFFGRDLKEREVRYVTAFAAKMFSKIPVFLKDTHEINSYAARKYQVKPFAGRLTLFRASVQADSSIPPDNGWGPIFSKGIEVHETPGDHWKVLSEPGIDVLARSIANCLNRFNEAPK